jgi:hypothetical protein
METKKAAEIENKNLLHSNYVLYYLKFNLMR